MPLSGKGAALKGARLNSVGVELIYTAANRSLAMAEVAVHLTLATLPPDYVMMTIRLSDDISIRKLSEKELPPNWSAFPYLASLQTVGDKFVSESKYCVLQVPSAVTKGDFNFLINPRHADFKRIKVIGTEPFPIDTRIFS